MFLAMFALRAQLATPMLPATNRPAPTLNAPDALRGGVFMPWVAHPEPRGHALSVQIIDGPMPLLTT